MDPSFESDHVCNACQYQIANPGQRGAHYKSEWHRYNVKRRCAGLPAISQEMFENQLLALKKKKAESENSSAAQKCSLCIKSFNSESSYEAHLQTKSHQKRELSKQQHQQRKKEQGDMEDDEETSQKPTKSKSKSDSDKKVREDGENEMDEDDDDEEENPTDPIPSGQCLFCNQSFKNLQAAFDHMFKYHGFFVPFLEFCTDLEGFIDYLGVKVGVGRVCLYCNGRGRARYPSVASVQQHMRDKQHCKLRFEDESEEEEFGEFYHFPSQDVEEVDDEETEEITSNQIMKVNKGDQSVSLVDKEKGGSGPRRLAGMNDAGELMMTDGSVIGHRQFKHIYTQNLKPYDQRESVVAVSEVLANYRALQVPGYDQQKKQTSTQPQWRDRHHDGRVKLRVNMASNMQKHYRDQTAV